MNFNQQLTMYHGENYFEVAPKSQKYCDLAKYFQNIQFLPMAQYAVQGEAILVTRIFFQELIKLITSLCVKKSFKKPLLAVMDHFWSY